MRQNARWVGLVVDDVEGRYEVEPFHVVEFRDVLRFVRYVGESVFPGPCSASFDGAREKVVSREPAVRICPGHFGDGVAAPATDVEHLYTLLQPVLYSRDERQYMVQKRDDDGLHALFGHDFVEAGEFL